MAHGVCVQEGKRGRVDLLMGDHTDIYHIDIETHAHELE